MTLTGTKTTLDALAVIIREAIFPRLETPSQVIGALVSTLFDVRRQTSGARDSLVQHVVPLLRQEAGHPKIVVLCGSTKFKEAFERANREESLAGRIVLTVAQYTQADALPLTPEQKANLDGLYFRKIDLADEVLVLNVGGYIGESARNEIAYAQKAGKPVRYLEPGEVFA